MSQFIIKGAAPSQHKDCIYKACTLQEGDLLKCTNLVADGQIPCTKIIHVKCSGYNPSVVPYLPCFYCARCTANNESLDLAMKESVKKAEKMMKVSITKEDQMFQDTKNLGEKANAQLAKALEELRIQKEINSKQQAELIELRESKARKDAINQEKFFDLNESVVCLDKWSDTLHHAEGIPDKSKTTAAVSNSTKNSSINKSVFDSSCTQSGWPDYEAQKAEAAKIDRYGLLLERSSLPKLQPFTGDVTQWATFLSEFIRTSQRGHFRDFEDMDRLREAITSHALQTFDAELKTPTADPIGVLKAMDRMYGVRGNAVQLVLDKINQLQKVQRKDDFKSLNNLYSLIKQYKLQCIIHNKTVSNDAVLYIVQSKMYEGHVNAWKSWARDHHHQVDLEGLIEFMADKICDLNFKGNDKSKPSATARVNTADVAERSQNWGTESPNSKGTSSRKRDSNQNREKKEKKTRKARYENCECFQCKEKHPFYKCPQLISANAAKRIEIVNQLHICTRCLCSNKHKVEECPHRCLRCSINDCTIKNKHPLLHGHSNDQLSKFTTTIAHADVRFLQTASHFAMVPGQVIARDGSLIPITIMYDGGAGVSLATSGLFEQAQYESQLEYELTLRWATGATYTDSKAKLFSLKFLPHGKKTPITIGNITAVGQLELPEQEQDAKEFKRKYPHLREVPLPSYRRQAPQVLLGLSHAGIMSHISSIRSEKEGEPVAALTSLGWVVYGNYSDSPRSRITPKATLGLTTQVKNAEPTNDELMKYIRTCNDVDSIGIMHKDASLLSADDQIADKIIKSTMKYVQDAKRYEIGLLWKNALDTMPDNYEQAVQRLISTEKRLQKLDMVKFVQDQFTEQIKNGWLEETTRETANQHPRRNYVYGFLTFNKNKTPPKPRWVNDTAATYKGISLNSKLLKGPDSLVPLPQSMCCLREGRIAFQSDVKSMFNQVKLKPEDQFSQLTLWRDGDSSKEPRIYRQTRIIFGPTCSPSITSAIRIKHAENCAAEFPEAADVAIHQMYVDDAPDSRDNLQQAAKVANDLITMFARIGWPLVQFVSNDNNLLKLLPPENVNEKMVEVRSEDDEYITKVLGIYWKPKNDVYVYRLNDDQLIFKCIHQGYIPTKKEMLSIIMRIFDPLGQIAPFRIRGHMLMQQVWRVGTDWSKKPPKDISDEFSKWLNDFEAVAKLEIPRPYTLSPLKDSKLSLHIFVDAGTEAYAACAYIRIENAVTIEVRLIAAKARVTPIRYVSIPKKELMSGCLGARLKEAVMEWHRRLTFEEYTCWTDSVVVLKWLQTRHLPRTAFTAPRIAEIQELAPADHWKYVPSLLNVADYGTKERQMDYSDAKHEWFTGPKFLYEPRENWPKQPTHELMTKALEVAVSHVKVVNGKAEGETAVLKQLSAKVRSKWPLLARVVAKALRFADQLTKQRQNIQRPNFMTNYEIERAENYVIKLVQMSSFPEEYESLTKFNKVRKSSPLYNFSPIMCRQTMLIRATTRLSSNFPLNMRSPPILPNFHEVTDAIVRYFHNINLHVGDKAITAQIRSRVWIINAKRAVRRCRARCLHCLQKRTKPATANRADLPDFRLDINEKPFFHTGCDLFGPFKVYTGRSRHKSDIQIVIFTCMVTRAVYFEVLDDKSTASFLTALDKLWARRGPIAHMYSDNGLNFVGAARVLERDEFQKAASEKRITWHFNPAYTPQFGGAWERLIKDVKRGLEASLGKFTVPRLSMEAALARIEANLNNRPLTELPVSSVEDIPISPYLLMTGYPNYPAMDDSSDVDLANPPTIMNIKPARRINALVQAFRHRFISEYAPMITRRPVNSANDKYLLKDNDYVMYMDPTKNPSEWLRGVICKIYPGNDAAIRVADIRLKNGNIIERRPAHLIAKIDIRLDDNEAEQSRYATSCNILVNVNSNLKLSVTEAERSKKSTTPREFFEERRNKLKNKIKMASGRENDGITFVSVPEMQEGSNVELTYEEYVKYIDTSGKSVINVKNIPAKVGAGILFSAMADYGLVIMICCSKYDGRNPYSCFIGFEDKASVDTCILWQESHVIIVDNVAHKLTFERLEREFKPTKSVRKPIFIFIDMEQPSQRSQRILFITNRNSDERRIPMPTATMANALTVVCQRQFKYEFETFEVNQNDEDAVKLLPKVLKPGEEVMEDPVEPSAHRSSGLKESSDDSEKDELEQPSTSRQAKSILSKKQDGKKTRPSRAAEESASVVEPSVHDARSISLDNGNMFIRIRNEHQVEHPAAVPNLLITISERKDIKKLKSYIVKP